MLLLAFVAFVFGLLASLAFSAAPFIVGNIAATLSILALGLLSGWSLKFVVAELAVAVVSLQAGYFAGIVGQLRRLRRAERSANGEPRREGANGKTSTMDHTG